jgi:DNA-binding NtrC family response regulator
MEEDKSLLHEVAADAYDASDLPFDFIEAESETAIICESDPQMKEAVSVALKELGYQITDASSVRDVLKRMRFHSYDVVVLNENFDAPNPDANDVLSYLQGLSMDVRRQMFVVLVSKKYRTMDNMAAFHRSVNLVINPMNLEIIGKIIQRGVKDNAAFYRVFKEAMRKAGKA